MAVKAIPEGYHSLTPSLTVSDAKKAIEFYQKAFGAKELNRAPGPDGRLMHAEIKIGDSILMLNDSFPEMGGNPAPAADASLPSSLHLYVENADAVFERAVKAGATVTMPLMDMFWGDRYGRIRDPFGHSWAIATHKEDLTPEQMMARQQEAMKSAGKPG
jgi:uncharacterized glyoxalase superfamily protein PhnB